MLIFVVAFFGLFVVCIYLLAPLFTPRKIKLNGAHVVVTGGSSGIGKAVAVEVFKRGANVTLLARNQGRLDEAKKEVEQARQNSSRVIQVISVDLSSEYTAVEKAIEKACEALGPVEMLVNSAGISMASRFEDVPIEDFQRLMNVNYLGTVFACRAVLPGMKTRQSGRIVFLSSQAGQIGLFGYTPYCATKFALRGFAEALQMEVKPYNIRLTLSFPPDTDTPGYAEELKMKPKETKLIAETAGLFQADYVARVLVDDSVAGKFFSYIGLDGFMLACSTCGMSPTSSILDVLQQILTMAPFRLIGLFYLRFFDGIVKQCKTEREASEEARKQQ